MERKSSRVNGKPLVSIVSAGLSKFGKLDGLYAREIFAQAAKEAFDRCPNLDPKKDIKALFVGHMGESYEHQEHGVAAMADGGDIFAPVCPGCSYDSPICPTNKALISF